MEDAPQFSGEDSQPSAPPNPLIEAGYPSSQRVQPNSPRWNRLAATAAFVLAVATLLRWSASSSGSPSPTPAPTPPAHPTTASGSSLSASSSDPNPGILSSVLSFLSSSMSSSAPTSPSSSSPSSLVATVSSSLLGSFSPLNRPWLRTLGILGFAACLAYKLPDVASYLNRLFALAAGRNPNLQTSSSSSRSFFMSPSSSLSAYSASSAAAASSSSSSATSSSSSRLAAHGFIRDARMAVTKGGRQVLEHRYSIDIDVFESLAITTDVDTNGVHLRDRPPVSLFGMYDGHGGTYACEFVRANISALLRQDPQRFFADPQKRLNEVLVELDQRFLEIANEEEREDGTGVTVALIMGGLLLVSNVGDAQAVMCRAGQATVLSTLHSPSTNRFEIERVTAAGGVIVKSSLGHPELNFRLFNLPVSRAIGHRMFKDERFTKGHNSGLIAEPDSSSVILGDLDEFLLLASAGLWRSLSHQEACDHLRAQLKRVTAENAVSSLINLALSRNRRPENVAIILVRFRTPGG